MSNVQQGMSNNEVEEDKRRCEILGPWTLAIGYWTFIFRPFLLPWTLAIRYWTFILSLPSFSLGHWPFDIGHSSFDSSFDPSFLGLWTFDPLSFPAHRQKRGITAPLCGFHGAGNGFEPPPSLSLPKEGLGRPSSAVASLPAPPGPRAGRPLIGGTSPFPRTPSPGRVFESLVFSGADGKRGASLPLSALFMERETGFEPATPTLARLCSTS